MSLKEANNNKLQIDWSKFTAYKPSFLGTKAFLDTPIKDGL